MAEAKTTTDRKKIQQWVEKRGGKPACVRGTGGKGDTGLLRIDFPGYSGAETLQEIGWDEFFEKFEEQNLAFLYQDTMAGGDPSNFSKFVDRNSTEGRRGGKKKAARGKAGGAAARGTGKKAMKKGSKSAKTAKSASRKKSAPASRAAGGKKAPKKAAKKAPKKSAGGSKKTAKADGRKKAGRR